VKATFIQLGEDKFRLSLSLVKVMRRHIALTIGAG